MLVLDINPGSSNAYVYDMINVNGMLIFRATDAAHGTKLWRSDGTSSGTQIVADIQPGTDGSFPKG